MNWGVKNMLNVQTICIAIGVITLHTATLDAKLVTKTVKIMTISNMQYVGKYRRFLSISPIFPFKFVYCGFEASDKANPPPVDND